MEFARSHESSRGTPASRPGAHFSIYRLNYKSFHPPKQSPRRIRLFLALMIAVAVLASCNALPTNIYAETRLLRSMKTAANHDAAAEERGAFSYQFNFNLLDDILHSLPDQFKRIKDEPEFLRFIFASWKSGFGTSKEAVAFMKSQGLNEKAIKQFKAAYKAYLAHKRL
ncbi:secreted RxLR effector peptide protein, putative [Phytophthora infestans T30-4]